MSASLPTPAPRVLIVEDELIVAEDIASRLRRLGYIVAGQTNLGDEAVTLTDELRPDLILMDIRLGGPTDGVAAAEAIRKQFRLPVVYLTAHADEATLQRAKVTEPFGYVIKPFEERELRTVIEIVRYRHKAEKRLAESERRYATTLASIGDAVIATDEAGHVTYMNPVAEKLTGCVAEENRGKPLSEVFRIVHEGTREEVENPVEKVIRSGTVIGLANHTLLLARDGCEYPIDDCAAPIHDDDGQTTGVVLVFRDVTEERRREEEMRQAQKMEAVGRLAGGIAHDFNNLLTVMRGYCSLLLETAGIDHPWYGSIAEVARASDRAADLTRQLLSFGRKQMLQPKVIDLNHVIADSLKLLRRLIAANIELVTDIHPVPLMTKADPGQLEQVIINLAINARDAMPRGGRLTLRTSSMSASPEGELQFGVLTVVDTGCGMDGETKSRIWEPFFTTKDVGKGTGLGLATVYSIVKQCGGLIEVESEPDRGATFRAALPLTEEAPFVPAQLPLPQLPSGTETILLVEDDDGVRGLASQLLRGAGYTLLEARNGLEALEVAGRFSAPIHLLITDLVMPQMSGRTVSDILSSQRPDMPTLFISGYCEEAVLRSGREGETIHLLNKPFSPKSLATKVREVLSVRSA